MIVFRNYLKIVKSFLPVIIMYVGIFSLITVLMTTTTEDQFIPTVIRTAVINNDDNSILSRTFTLYIEETSEIIEIDEEEEAIADALFGRMVDYVVIIPEGFSEQFMRGYDVQIDTKGVPDSAAGTFAEVLYNPFWQIARIYQMIGMNEEQIANILLDDLRTSSEVRLLDNQRDALNNVNMFYNFTNWTFLATTIFVIGMVMVIFSEHKMKNRNLVSPISIKRLNTELFLGNICIAILIWLLYVILSIFLFGDIMFSNQGLLMILNAFIFTVAVLSLAFLIGSLVTNKVAQNGIVNIIALGLSFISGSFVPQEMLGEFVLSIARFFPSYWFIRNNNEIVNLSNFDWINLEPIIINMGVVLFFAILFFIITNITSKIKIRR